MILRLIAYKKNSEMPLGKEIVNIHEVDCSNVYRKDKQFNSRATHLFGYGVYDLVHGIADGFEVVEVKE